MSRCPSVAHASVDRCRQAPAKTTKKITLRLTCTNCKSVRLKPIKRSKHFEICDKKPKGKQMFARLRLGVRHAPVAAAGLAAFGAASATECSWMSIDSMYELLSPPAALSPAEWRPLKVFSVEQLTHNTKRLRFTFPDVHAAAGMEVASCLVTRAFIGKLKEDGTRGVVVRPYTPSHTTVGYLELVIKEYPEGKMSKHIASLKVGDTLEFKGPIPKFSYITNAFSHVGMVAGGSGITPMLQVAERILDNPHDDTQEVSLVFANVTEDDILLRDKIDEMRAAHPDQFKVTYVLDSPPPGWDGPSGLLSPEILRESLPPPGIVTKILVCGPPGMVAAVCGPKANNEKDQGEVCGHLRTLGFTSEHVFKF
ncbi:hypothetical protein AB1Y20_020455 [Prymnesium parvum]|uniref:NADH-cytochrome b5 reductase n=1 Tax=Prymnesium parvum TaxID=97485 RepID=A0AB34JY16_PRYPA